MTLTYGEMRTNAERIEDEALKARILRGIEVLNEKHGPDWVDKIDPGSLDLCSARYCVLGQVYDGATVTEDQWSAFAVDHDWAYSDHWSKSDGYSRGLAILNADVATSPSAYGFETTYDEPYDVLDEAWLTVLGEEV